MTNSDYRFSLWGNLKKVKSPLAEWDVDDLLKAIQSGQGAQGSFQEAIKKLRANPSKETKQRLKTEELPAVSLSGIFSSRNRKGFVEHSGLMQVDIDDVDDLNKTMRRVQRDTYTFVSFLSPSGTGIKCIVKVNPEEHSHLEQFHALQKHYRNHLEIEIDPRCKNLDRCMLLSFDEGVFHKPEADVFAGRCLPSLPQKKTHSRSKTYQNYGINNFEQSEEELDKLIHLIESREVDITQNYEDWYRIAYGLDSELGERGREYFHRISRFYETYSETECDRQYDYAIKRNNHSIQIGTVFYIAAQCGVKLESQIAESLVADPKSVYQTKKPQKPRIKDTQTSAVEASLSKIEFNKEETELFEALRKLRLDISRQENIKAFQVFSNSTLHELVNQIPTSAEDLLKCRGIGPRKLMDYGKVILEITKAYR